MPTPKQLANLRAPMKRGDPSRNPAGRNQYSADRELRQEYRALCRAIDEAPGPVSEEICREFATALADRLANWDRGSERLFMAWLDREWPLPNPQQYARVRENSERRAASWARRSFPFPNAGVQKLDP